jgi:hypothetical protein
MTTTLYKPGDRIALTVRLAGDHGEWIAHPGDIAEIMQITSASDIERGSCQCDGPFYAVHFDHIPHATLEYVCQHQVEATTTTTTQCPCVICENYFDGACDVCGASITPAHELLRVSGFVPVENRYGERAFDACKACAGPEVVAVITALTAKVQAKAAARQAAYDAFRQAERAADDAFRQATVGQIAARRLALEAAAAAYNAAGGYVNVSPGGSSAITLEPSENPF